MEAALKVQVEEMIATATKVPRTSGDLTAVIVQSFYTPKKYNVGIQFWTKEQIKAGGQRENSDGSVSHFLQVLPDEVTYNTTPTLLDAAQLALKELREFYTDNESEAIRVLKLAIANELGKSALVPDSVVMEYTRRNGRKEGLLYNNRILSGMKSYAAQYDVNRDWILATYPKHSV